MSKALLPFGINISKAELHVALLKHAQRSKYEHFTNDEDGFQPRSQWLVKGYSKSQLSRTKSDLADAKSIAQFCRDLKPAPWQPLAAEVSQSQGYTRRLDALVHRLTEEKNRLKVTAPDLVADY